MASLSPSTLLEVANGLLERGYAAISPDGSLEAELDALWTTSAAVFGRLSELSSLKAKAPLIHKKVGFHQEAGGLSLFTYREGGFTDAHFEGLTETQKRAAKQLIARQERAYGQLGAFAMRVLHALGIFDGGSAGKSGALVLQTDKGMKAGSGGGMPGNASMCSFSVQRCDNKDLAQAPESVDCSLITVAVVPSGDASLQLWDKKELKMVAPAAQGASTPSSGGGNMGGATGSRMSIVVFLGHLFDVAWSNSSGDFSTPHQWVASSGPVAGAQAAADDPGAVAAAPSDEKFAFLFRAVPHKRADLDLSRAAASGTVLLPPSSARDPLRCLQVITAFAGAEEGEGVDEKDEEERSFAAAAAEALAAIKSKVKASADEESGSSAAGGLTVSTAAPPAPAAASAIISPSSAAGSTPTNGGDAGTITVHVKAPDGTVLSVKASLLEKVVRVRNRVASSKQVHVCPEKHTLLRATHPREINLDHTVQEAGIQPGDTLTLTMLRGASSSSSSASASAPAAPPAGSAAAAFAAAASAALAGGSGPGSAAGPAVATKITKKVGINTPEGRTFVLDLDDPDETVAAVLKRIHKTKQAPKHFNALYLKGSLLAHDRTVGSLPLPTKFGFLELKSAPYPAGPGAAFIAGTGDAPGSGAASVVSATAPAPAAPPVAPHAAPVAAAGAGAGSTAAPSHPRVPTGPGTPFVAPGLPPPAIALPSVLTIKVKTATAVGGFSLVMGINERLIDLRTRLRERPGLPASQYLIFKGKLLSYHQNKEKLTDLGFGQAGAAGDVVTLTDGSIRLHVKMLDGEDVLCNARYNNTVSSIKAALGAPAGALLVLAGKRLTEEAQTLEACGVTDGSVLVFEMAGAAAGSGVLAITLKAKGGKSAVVLAKPDEPLSKLVDSARTSLGLGGAGKLFFSVNGSWVVAGEDSPSPALSQSLADNNVANGSTIFVTEGMLTVIVRQSKGSAAPFILDLGLEDDVKSLKAKVQEKIGIPPDEQSLAFGTNGLQEGRGPTATLRSLGLQESSVLQLTTGEMTVFFKPSPDAAVVPVTARVTDTLEEVKKKIEHQAGAFLGRALLQSAASDRFLRPSATLAFYGLQHGCHLKGTPPDVPVTVFVQVVGGRKVAIEATQGDTIGTIKAQLREKEGIPVESQRLIFAGQQLQNESTLLDYDIQPAALLFMIPKGHTSSS